MSSRHITALLVLLLRINILQQVCLLQICSNSSNSSSSNSSLSLTLSNGRLKEHAPRGQRRGTVGHCQLLDGSLDAPYPASGQLAAQTVPATSGADRQSANTWATLKTSIWRGLQDTHQLGSSLAGSGDIHTAVTGPGLAICTQIWAFQMQVLVD